MLIIQTITPMKALKYMEILTRYSSGEKLAVDDGKLVQEKLGTYIKRGLRQPLA